MVSFHSFFVNVYQAGYPLNHPALSLNQTYLETIRLGLYLRTNVLKGMRSV